METPKEPNWSSARNIWKWTRFRWRQIIKSVGSSDMLINAYLLASIHNFSVLGLSHGAAWRLFVQRRDEQFNCFRLPEKHPPPTTRLIAPESPLLQCVQHWSCTLADSVGHCVAVSSGCMGSRQLWANGAPQILSGWHWLLGQYRPSSPSARRYDPVDHSAMSSRLATRICLDMSPLITNNMVTIISQGNCGATNTSWPAPLVILSRFFLPFHLSWPPNIGQSCRICSWRLIYCR